MRRQRKLRLTPSWLPVIRDHLVEDGRQRAALAKTGGLLPVGELVDSMYGELDGLEAASLWWVNSDMCKVVEAQFRSGELPEPPNIPRPTVSSRTRTVSHASRTLARCWSTPSHGRQQLGG